MTTLSEPLIGINALAYYLRRITAFLENEKKILYFRQITSELQEILLRVVEENPKFLDSDAFSEAVRSEAAKVAIALKECERKNVKIVGQISDGKHGPNVLSYVKTQYTPKPLFKVPEPPEIPSQSKLTEPPPGVSGVSPSFKMNCLNKCSNFVKDDSLTVIRFPDMTAQQAQFLINIVEPGKEGKSESTDIGFGFRSMYAPLWEAMRVYSSKYDYNIHYDNDNQDGLKCVVFEKIPKTQKPEPKVDPEIIDVDALDDHSKENNPVSTSAMRAKKKKSCTTVGTSIKVIGVRMRNGSLVPSFVHSACRDIAEFMKNDEQRNLVFEKPTRKQAQFLAAIHRLSCTPASYMLFTSECQRYMDDIRYCYNLRDVRYTVKRRTDQSLVFEKCNKSDVDSDLCEILSTSSEPTISSAADSKSPKVSKNEPTIKAMPIPKLEKVMASLAVCRKNGSLTEEYIENTLTSIVDFYNDEQQGSILFKNPTASQKVFLQHIGKICVKPLYHKYFNATCQRLLGEVSKMFHGLSATRFSGINDCKGGRDMIIVRKVSFARKCRCEMDNHTACPTSSNAPKPTSQTAQVQTSTSPVANKLQAPQVSTMTPNEPKPTNTPQKQQPIDINKLTSLKAIIYDTFNQCGDQSVIDLLSDIANFLRMDNTDRTITFDELTETEATFVKHVRAASKVEDVFAMFTRDCQRLLGDIRDNAQRFKLTYKMVPHGKRKGICTVILEKQAASPQKAPVQHRARSLSAGRRAVHMAANWRIEPIPRGSSGQRPARAKETLKAALAQPVHSDKALKMMESMGWKGGALGPRGEGITEPIALPLDLVSRAGLGHVPKPKKAKEPTRKRQPRHEAPITPEATSHMMELSKEYTEWMRELVPLGILPPKSSDKQQMKTKSISLQKKDYHAVVLKSILAIITTDVDAIYFAVPSAGTKTPNKILGFVKHAVNIFNKRHDFTEMCDDNITEIVGQIQYALAHNFHIELNAEMTDNGIKVIKTNLIPIARKSNKRKNGVILTDQEFKFSHVDKTAVDDINNDNITDDHKDAIDEKERTTNVVDLTFDSKDTRASRPWYFPLKKIEKKIEKTSQVPSLLSIVLLQVIKCLDVNSSKNAANNEEQDQVTDTCKEPENNKSIKGKTTETKAVDKDKTSKVIDDVWKNVQTALQITKEFAKNRTQGTGVSSLPNFVPSTDCNDIVKQKVTEKSTMIIEPEIINDTAVDIQKALEKIIPNQKTKENVFQNNDKTTKNVNPPGTINIQPNDKTTVKNVKIPNLTRKKLAQLKEYGVLPDTESQNTTYRLRVEEYKIDKVKHVDVKVNKYAAKIANKEARRRRMMERNRFFESISSAEKDKNVTENHKTPGMILLEKLMVNNNDLTQNKNPTTQDDIPKSPKSTDAKRLVNAKSDINATVNDKSKDVKITKDIKSVTNNTVPKPAPAVNKVAPMIKIIETIDLTEDDVPNIRVTIKNTDQVRTVITEPSSEKNTTNIENITSKNKDSDLSQNENETVTYIVPIEYSKRVETIKIENTYDTNDITQEVNEEKDVHNYQNIETDSNNVVIKGTSNTNNAIIRDNENRQIGYDNSVSTMVTTSNDEAVSLECDNMPNLNEKSVPLSENCETVSKEADNNSDDFYDTTDVLIESEEKKRESTSQERKRQSTDFDSIWPCNKPKKAKLLFDFKRANIQPKDYPQTKMDTTKAREFQSAILNSITKATLPILKCRGIQNGCLIYDCHDEKSIFFLEDLVTKMTDLKLTYERLPTDNTHKVVFRLNSYIIESDLNIFKRLELYNPDLDTTDWSVLKKEYHEGFCIYHVEIDDKSFDHVCNSNFILCAGNDCARFTILWE